MVSTNVQVQHSQLTQGTLKLYMCYIITIHIYLTLQFHQHCEKLCLLSSAFSRLSFTFQLWNFTKRFLVYIYILTQPNKRYTFILSTVINGSVFSFRVHTYEGKQVGKSAACKQGIFFVAFPCAFTHE